MATSVVRSPNYPSVGLGEAIELARAVYGFEKRAKFPRLSLAMHLGYSSLNGRALSKIGALRAYGLIEGREDALAISPRALALIDAPQESPDYAEALHSAFKGPPLFAKIIAAHGEDVPSPQTLRWWLSKQGYVGEAADKALKVYLASAELVNSLQSGYSSPQAPDVDEVADKPESPSGEAFPAHVVERSAAQLQSESLAMGVQERVLQSGMLSKTASYRVVVSGQVGVAEIDRLLRKLEMDKEILADPDPFDDVDGVETSRLD